MNIRKLLTRLVSLALIAVFLPTVAMADTWYLEDGSITVSATENGQNVSQGGVTKEDSAPVIRNRDSSASTTNNVTIRADTGATANVTLEDTNIDTTGGAGPKSAGDAAVRTEGGGNVNLQVYCSQISSLISALIIYLCAFVGFFKYFIQTRLRKADERKAAKAAQIQEGGEDK